MFPTQRLLAAVSQPFKRSQLGLFQGKTRQTGNSIPFSKHKTRRSWLPNVQSKRYFSDAFQQWIKVKVTTRAIKTIKKYDGSLDKYVLNTKPELLGWEGMRIRIAVRERLAEAGTLEEVMAKAAPKPIAATVPVTPVDAVQAAQPARP